MAACATRTAPAATPAGVAAPQGYATVAEYRAARERLIQEDRGRRLGAGLVLTAAEEAANTRLMALKQAELDRTRDYFPPAHSFLRERTKEAMAGSRVLEVMRRLPKGGVLHAHGGALGDFRWLVANVTYRPDCYMYVGPAAAPPRGTLRLADQSPGEGWRLVRELRAEAPDAAAFDAEIYRSITLGEEDLAAPDIWVEFGTIFRRVGGVVSHPSVGPDYWRNLLAALIDENVQYLESRSVGIDQAIIRDARGRDSAFGVRFIAAGGRSATRERIAQTPEGGRRSARDQTPSASPASISWKKRIGTTPISSTWRSCWRRSRRRRAAASRCRSISTPARATGRRTRISTTRCCSARRASGTAWRSTSTRG